MGRMLLVRFVMGAVVLFAGVAHAQEESAYSDPRMRRVVATLEKRSDADSLAAAGALRLGPNQEKSLVLMAKASALAPDRADLLWLHLQVCRAAPPCDPQPLEQRLRVLDPPNGAGWLGALARASTAQDDQARDAALLAISRAERMDLYWSVLVKHLAGALTSAKALNPSEAGVAVIGVLSARVIPPFVTVSKACNGERLEHPDVVEVCRGVAQAFQHGDTYITEMLGTNIAKRVWPAGSAQWQAADQARHVYEYRSRLISQLGATQGPGVVVTLLTFYERNRREQDAQGAFLTASGKSPDPPAAASAE